MTAAEGLADDALRTRLYEHAMACFPEEACALLLAGPDGPELVLADNLAAAQHAADPEGWPRPAERSYLLDVRLIAAAEQRGRRLVAIVHSHVRVGAYFSAEDARWALTPSGDPLYPGVEHVVLDAQDDGVSGFVTFAWDEAEQRFVAR